MDDNMTVTHNEPGGTHQTAPMTERHGPAGQPGHRSQHVHGLPGPHGSRTGPTSRARRARSSRLPKRASKKRGLLESINTRHGGWLHGGGSTTGGLASHEGVSCLGAHCPRAGTRLRSLAVQTIRCGGNTHRFDQNALTIRDGAGRGIALDVQRSLGVPPPATRRGGAKHRLTICAGKKCVDAAAAQTLAPVFWSPK